jgi:hypothetical protein
MKKQKKKTDTQLAKRYGTDTRTIRAWRKAEAPLLNHKSMLEWVSTRQRIPARLASKHEKGDTVETPNATTEQPGAAAALGRLERMELTAHARMQRALSGSDPLAIKSARESYLRIMEQLRHMERAISEDKRQRGELVSRKEVVDGLRFLGYCMRIGSGQILPQLAAELASEQDTIRAREIIEEANYGIAVVSYAAMWGSKYVPKWIVEAVSGDLTTNINVRSDELQRLGTVIQEACEASLHNVLIAHPKTPPE